jgi:hypothetical protein
MSTSLITSRVRHTCGLMTTARDRVGLPRCAMEARSIAPCTDGGVVGADSAHAVHEGRCCPSIRAVPTRLAVEASHCTRRRTQRARSTWFAGALATARGVAARKALETRTQATAPRRRIVRASWTRPARGVAACPGFRIHRASWARCECLTHRSRALLRTETTGRTRGTHRRARVLGERTARTSEACIGR